MTYNLSFLWEQGFSPPPQDLSGYHFGWTGALIHVRDLGEIGCRAVRPSPGP